MMQPIPNLGGKKNKNKQWPFGQPQPNSQAWHQQQNWNQSPPQFTNNNIVQTMYSPPQQDIRPPFSHMFLKTCILWRERSTCQRIQTAAIVARDNNIISIGYNGVPRGHKHCLNFWREFYNCAKGTANKGPDVEMQTFYQAAIRDLQFNESMLNPHRTYEEFVASDAFAILHHYWSDVNEIHAEQNALLQAESSTAGATLYTLYGPCRQCAKSIISAKINKVVYHEEYLRDTEGITLLRKSGVEVEKIV